VGKRPCMPMSCVHDTVCEWRLQPPRVAAGSDRGTGPFAPAAESTPGALFDAPAGAACAGERVQPARAWHARRGAEARRTCALTICCRCAAICAAAIAAEVEVAREARAERVRIPARPQRARREMSFFRCQMRVDLQLSNSPTLQLSNSPTLQLCERCRIHSNPCLVIGSVHWFSSLV
jgi:hypothetical protein